MKSIGIAAISYWLQIWLETTALTDFLKGNLITILVTVVAINSATLAVLTSKMAEISRLKGVSIRVAFGPSLAQMKLSMKEMLALIILAVLLLIFMHGQSANYRPDVLSPAINILFTSVFVYALFILHDTGMAIFSIHDSQA